MNEGEVRVGDLWCGCRGTKENGDDDHDSDGMMMVRVMSYNLQATTSSHYRQYHQ